MLSMWQHLKDLKQTFAGSHRAEQLRQRVQEREVATVEDSLLRTPMEQLRLRAQQRSIASTEVPLVRTPMENLESDEEHGLCQASEAFRILCLLPLVSVSVQYRPWRCFLSRLVVAKRLVMMLWAIMLAPVPFRVARSS